MDIEEYVSIINREAVNGDSCRVILFPPELDRLVREELASGIYRSEDDLLLEAIQALRDRDEAIVGIQEGIADMNAGRVRSLEAVDVEMRKKYDISRMENTVLDYDYDKIKNI